MGVPNSRPLNTDTTNIPNVVVPQAAAPTAAAAAPTNTAAAPTNTAAAPTSWSAVVLVIMFIVIVIVAVAAAHTRGGGQLAAETSHIAQAATPFAFAAT